jgi:hypothetical protein
MRAPITVVNIAKDDGQYIREVFAKIRPWVDEIIVGVQPSVDDTRAACEEVADIVVDVESTPHTQMQLEPLIAQAKHPIILFLTSDECIAHPERLAEVVTWDADIWWLPRVDFLNGNRVQFHMQDPQPRLFRKGALRFVQQMHTYPEFLSKKIADVRECWFEHRRTIEGLRRRMPEFNKAAEESGEAERVVPGQSGLLTKAEDITRRQNDPKYRPRILLSYNGVVGIGDTLMTTPVVRALREQYPKARIEYLTQQGVVLQNNPYINEIWHDPPEKWNPEREQRYDIVIHWETSLTGEPGKRLNGYECEAYWAYVDVENYHPDWFVTKGERGWARAFIKEHVKTPRLVGMALSSSCLHRTWPRSFEFVQRFMETYPDVTLVFMGDPRCQVLEMRTEQRLDLVTPLGMGLYEINGQRRRMEPQDFGLNEMPKRPFRAAPAYKGPGHERILRTSGRISLREAAALVGELDLLIAPDSGLMHVAAALDTPCVAYFNLVPPELRVKHMPNVIPITANWECSPCFIHGTIDCSKTHPDRGAPCLYAITPDMMLDAIAKVLG